MTAEWWRDLTGEDLLVNLHGDPPYDVDAVADHVTTMLGHIDGVVIEIGCGAGRLQRAMVGRGLQVEGVDVNPIAVDVAHETGLVVELVTGDGLLRSWAANTAPGAYSVTVFQHMPEEVQRRYLVELARVVAHGGRIVIQHVLGAERGPQSRQVTADEWETWCHDAGLEFTSLTTGCGDPSWVWFGMVAR